ncbi:MAG: RNA methyltransferase [Candidatus Magasanikbacteria bacterium]
MLSHKIIKHLNQLQQKKYRREFKEFVVEGIKGVEEALTADAEVILAVVEGIRRDEEDIQKIIKLLNIKSIPIEFCGRKEVDEIKTTDTFPGMLIVISQPEFYLEDLVEGPIICLDGVKDPGNLGTIIRTADWFGVKNILLSEDSVDPYNEKVVRSTMGSIFHLNIFESDHLVNSIVKLKNDFGYKVKALDTKGKNIDTLKPVKKTVYLFGSESHGIRSELDELVDERYTIPGGGEAESLNVAVSAGILMSYL